VKDTCVKKYNIIACTDIIRCILDLISYIFLRHRFNSGSRRSETAAATATSSSAATTASASSSSSVAAVTTRRSASLATSASNSAATTGTANNAGELKYSEKHGSSLSCRIDLGYFHTFLSCVTKIETKLRDSGSKRKCFYLY
jgi:hypothetical protein